MSRYPAKRKLRPVRTVEDVVVDAPGFFVKNNAGFSFSYSYAEFSLVGNSAQFKTRHARYQNGKLAAKTFEGELDPGSHEQLMIDLQRFFADQMALYLQAVRSFLPPFNRSRNGE